jgi:hypothetical protein
MKVINSKYYVAYIRKPCGPNIGPSATYCDSYNIA